MPHSEESRSPDGAGRTGTTPVTGTDPAGGDLQSDEAWADAGAGASPEPGATDEEPSFEDPSER